MRCTDIHIDDMCDVLTYKLCSAPFVLKSIYVCKGCKHVQSTSSVDIPHAKVRHATTTAATTATKTTKMYTTTITTSMMMTTL